MSGEPQFRFAQALFSCAGGHGVRLPQRGRSMQFPQLINAGKDSPREIMFFGPREIRGRRQDAKRLTPRCHTGNCPVIFALG